VAAPVGVLQLRWSYRRGASAHEGRVSRFALAARLMAAIPLAGCGMSFPISSLVSDQEPTGSVAKPPSPLSPELTGEDWRRAKGALAIALDPVGNGSSATWHNPDTGMKGSFIPVGQPFVNSDEVCRAFIAELNGQRLESTLQGTACRPSGRDWAIKDIKPWKKPA
jgi:hypothetical protein